MKKRNLKEILKELLMLKPQKPTISLLPWNAVIDADKSVSWNREAVEKNHKQYAKEQVMLRREYARKKKLLVDEVCDYISAELGGLDDETTIYIWRYAFTEATIHEDYDYMDVYCHLRNVLEFVKRAINSATSAKDTELPKFEKVIMNQYCCDPEWCKVAENGYAEIQLPKKRYKSSSYYEFFAPYDIILEPQSLKIVYTGVKCNLGDSYVLRVYPKSSLETGAKGIVSLDAPYVLIESDYYNNEVNEGHILLRMKNDKSYPISYRKGEVFAIGIIGKCE